MKSETVSCLMVTKNRLPVAKRAIHCFQRQSYSNRELVIVNDADDGTREYVEQLDDPRILYIRPAEGNLLLGDLRNVAVSHATGRFVIQWDDDDWYDRHRIAMQFAALSETKADLCVLERWTLAWPSKNMYCISKRQPWEGTMLASKKKLAKYPSIRRGEDTQVFRRGLADGLRVCVLDRPSLYVYVVHDCNTWSEQHFLASVFDKSTRELSLLEIARLRNNLGFGEGRSEITA